MKRGEKKVEGDEIYLVGEKATKENKEKLKERRKKECEVMPGVVGV